MAQEIDWLRSQSAVCKVNQYSTEGQKDQDRKMICFVDVSTIQAKSKMNKGYTPIDLGSLEEKEVIVIKDNERNNPNNTEGAVCLFKQASCDEINIVNWLNNDLQKYAIGFQHALTPPSGSRKNQPYTISADKLDGGHRTSPEDPSIVNKLCSMVVQKARQEIKDKLESGSNSMRQPLGSQGSEKPWSLDLHAKDIFGMALKMIQQHLAEKNGEGARERNVASPSYTNRERANGGNQQGARSPSRTSGSHDSSHHETPKTSVSGILLSLVQKVLRDAASSLQEGIQEANHSYKPAPPS